jgi:hypothetical protein
LLEIVFGNIAQNFSSLRHYVCFKEIGQGGFGVVWKAYNKFDLKEVILICHQCIPIHGVTAFSHKTHQSKGCREILFG